MANEHNKHNQKKHKDKHGQSTDLLQQTESNLVCWQQQAWPEPAWVFRCPAFFPQCRSAPHPGPLWSPVSLHTATTLWKPTKQKKRSFFCFQKQFTHLSDRCCIVSVPLLKQGNVQISTVDCKFSALFSLFFFLAGVSNLTSKLLDGTRSKRVACSYEHFLLVGQKPRRNLCQIGRLSDSVNPHKNNGERTAL